MAAVEEEVAGAHPATSPQEVLQQIHQILPKETRELHRDGIKLLGKDYYLGTFAADQLPAKVPPTQPWGLIVNNQPAKQPGQHWVAMCRTPEGQVHMFDTAGRHPKDIYRPWVRWMVDKMHSAPLRYNKLKVQTPMTPVCGFHCLHYLWLRRHESRKSPLYCQSRRFSDNRIARVFNDSAVIKWALDHHVPVMVRDK